MEKPNKAEIIKEKKRLIKTQEVVKK